MPSGKQTVTDDRLGSDTVRPCLAHTRLDIHRMESVMEQLVHAAVRQLPWKKGKTGRSEGT